MPILLHLFYDAASSVNLGQLAGALMGGYSGAIQGTRHYYYIYSMMQLACKHGSAGGALMGGYSSALQGPSLYYYFYSILQLAV
jgi:hypothetical protein